MKTIKNTTIRLFHLPIRESRSGEKFGKDVSLMPGQSLPVPDFYLAELLAEKNSAEKPTGWALRLEVQGDVATVKGPKGVAGSFAARIKAAREARAEALEQARKSDAQAAASDRRAAASEAEVARLTAQVAELSELVKKAAANAGGDAGSAPPSPPEPKTPKATGSKAKGRS